MCAPAPCSPATDRQARYGERDHSAYALRPLLLDAAEAHAQGFVRYDETGTVALWHPNLPGSEADAPVLIPPSRQYPLIRATFDDLNPKLSSLANSPLIDGARSLRRLYEEELARYEELASDAYQAGQWEPDYGTYAYDHLRGDLYLLAPAFWHRLGLVTSNAKLLTDPEGRLSWQETRRRLESLVVGFAGASVGSGIFEGWLRAGRPLRAKIADPDWLELTNLNRAERVSIRGLVGSRAQRFDRRSPYEVPRTNKAEYLAYEEHLVDPYATYYVYGDGLDRTNLERFLLGDGASEPGIDVLVEETDKFRLKVEVRELCRRHGIPVLMLTDVGHRAQVLWQDYRRDPQASLAYGVDDAALYDTLLRAERGGRRDVMGLLRTLCGDHYAADEFADWVGGAGEQMGASIPQLGTTAMVSGGLGGLLLAEYALGRPMPDRRLTLDLRDYMVIHE